MRTVGRKSAASRVIRSQVVWSFWLRRISVRRQRSTTWCRNALRFAALVGTARIGLRGKPFEIVKFRSMRIDAEPDGKARWAERHDQRVTRIGRFIRLTRIDEIPQLINVLRGEMRIIGPRPERPCFVQALSAQLPSFQRRHIVKPGITGWAQVRCGYAASLAEAAQKLEYDLYYIENRCLAFDLRILLETLRVVVRAQGAR